MNKTDVSSDCQCVKAYLNSFYIFKVQLTGCLENIAHTSGMESPDQN